MLYPFKISSLKLDALVTMLDPLVITVLPLFLGDLAHTPHDFLHDIVNCSEFYASHSSFEDGEKQEVARAEVRAIGRVLEYSNGHVL